MDSYSNYKIENRTRTKIRPNNDGQWLNAAAAIIGFTGMFTCIICMIVNAVPDSKQTIFGAVFLLSCIIESVGSYKFFRGIDANARPFAICGIFSVTLAWITVVRDLIS